jgi:hypothetical protein
VASKLNWNFRVNWLGEDHVLVSYKKQDAEQWQEFLFTVREYTEWMTLLQEFNTAFREDIDRKLVEHYYKDE